MTDAGAANARIGQQGKSIVAKVRNTSTSVEVEATNVLQAGVLVHAVVTDAPGANAKLYVNGALVANGTSSNDFANWDEAYPLQIGGTPQAVGTFRGTVLFAALSSTALSADAILGNFQQGPPLRLDDDIDLDGVADTFDGCPSIPDVLQTTTCD